MHTLASNLVHCVFSTRDRADLIKEPERTWQYIAGIARAKQIPLVAIGGTKNHVHLLVALPPAMSLAKVIQDIKGLKFAFCRNTKLDMNPRLRFVNPPSLSERRNV